MSEFTLLALEYLAPQLTEQRIALEGLGFLTRLFDTFGRLLHNIKTNLTQFHKTVKRSELQFYHDSHKSAVNQVLHTAQLPYDLLVPIPDGMKVTYRDAVAALQSLYDTLDIERTTAVLQNYFSQYPDGLQFTKLTVRPEINHLTKDEVEKRLRTVFSKTKTYDVPLGRVIKSQQELVSVDRVILGFQPIFQNVEVIVKQLDLIEKKLDQIVTQLEKQKTIDRAYVTVLHETVRVAAVQFQLYGVLLAELQRVEHNFVLVLRKLVQHQHEH